MARIAGHRPLALFDDERAHDVYPLALEQGLRVGQALSTGAGRRGPGGLAAGLPARREAQSVEAGLRSMLIELMQ